VCAWAVCVCSKGVLVQVHPDTGISTKSMAILDK
jgi:hypothetical protein